MADEAEVVETRLTLHFGATVAVTTDGNGWQDWIKPGASFSTTWKGTPSGEQIVTAAEHIQNNVIAPMIGDVISMCQDRMVEARRGG